MLTITHFWLEFEHNWGLDCHHTEIFGRFPLCRPKVPYEYTHSLLRLGLAQMEFLALGIWPKWEDRGTTLISYSTLPKSLLLQFLPLTKGMSRWLDQETSWPQATQCRSHKPWSVLLIKLLGFIYLFIFNTTITYYTKIKVKRTWYL